MVLLLWVYLAVHPETLHKAKTSYKLVTKTMFYKIKSQFDIYNITHSQIIDQLIPENLLDSNLELFSNWPGQGLIYMCRGRIEQSLTGRSFYNRLLRQKYQYCYFLNRIY